MSPVLPPGYACTKPSPIVARAGDVDDERFDLVGGTPDGSPNVTVALVLSGWWVPSRTRVEHALRRVETDEPAIGRRRRRLP